MKSFVKVRVEYSVIDMSQLERFDMELNRVTSVDIPKKISPFKRRKFVHRIKFPNILLK
jgi:hypothetical protein